MRPNRKQLIVLAVAVLVGLVVTAVILWRRPPEVEVATVKPQTVELALSVVGRARPMDLVQVVAAGETLFELGSAIGVEIRADLPHS